MLDYDHGVREQEVGQAREPECASERKEVGRGRTAPFTHPHIWPTYSIKPGEGDLLNACVAYQLSC